MSHSTGNAVLLTNSMYTLEELNAIDTWVRERQVGARSDGEETGLTLKEPREGGSNSYRLLRRLVHSLCGMHYETPQFNQLLLIYWLNNLSGLEVSVDSGTFSAPHDQLTFNANNKKISFSTQGEISKEEFVAAFK